MNWDFYTVSSIIAGIIFVLGAFVAPRVSAGGRLGIFVAGCGCVGYGVYVANQSSGFYMFPVQILAIPVIAVVYVVISAHESTKNPPGAASSTSDAWKSSFNNGVAPPAERNASAKHDE